MTKPKGFFRENGKTKPYHEKKGITGKQFKEGNPDTIKVKHEIIKLRKKGKDELISVDSGHGVHNKIIIKNGIVSPDHRILEAIISIWSDIPNDVKKTVKEIRVSETHDGSGAFGMWESKKHVLHLYLTNKISTVSDVEDTFSHELAHADFDSKIDSVPTNPKIKNKLAKYFDEMGLLPPITFYSKEFYDDWINSKSRSGQFDAEEQAKENGKLLSYINEEHSETAMYIASPDKQRGELGILYKPVMDEAVKNFKKLHSGK